MKKTYLYSVEVEGSTLAGLNATHSLSIINSTLIYQDSALRAVWIRVLN